MSALPEIPSILSTTSTVWTNFHPLVLSKLDCCVFSVSQFTPSHPSGQAQVPSFQVPPLRHFTSLHLSLMQPENKSNTMVANVNMFFNRLNG